MYCGINALLHNLRGTCVMCGCCSTPTPLRPCLSTALIKLLIVGAFSSRARSVSGIPIPMAARGSLTPNSLDQQDNWSLDLEGVLHHVRSFAGSQFEITPLVSTQTPGPRWSIEISSDQAHEASATLNFKFTDFESVLPIRLSLVYCQCRNHQSLLSY